MRIVFAGTPDFAASILEALIADGHSVSAVLCQPDRPVGRGQNYGVGPVKAKALHHGLPLYQPESLKSDKIQKDLQDLPADVWVVVAYGALIPPALLSAPRYGCLNIHASLLPRWRGAAPIQRAILAGDQETGISIMQMERGLDTGPVLLSQALPILEEDTAGSLHDALANLGAKLILEALRRLDELRLEAKPQPSEGASYAHKISKDEARVSWLEKATAIACRIRAFSPTPGAWCLLGDQRIRVGAAVPGASETRAAPGEVVSVHPHLEVGAGMGSLRLLTLQRPGGRMLSAEAFLRGTSIRPGDRFD